MFRSTTRDRTYCPKKTFYFGNYTRMNNIDSLEEIEKNSNLNSS